MPYIQAPCRTFLKIQLRIDLKIIKWILDTCKWNFENVLHEASTDDSMHWAPRDFSQSPPKVQVLFAIMKIHLIIKIRFLD